MAWLLSAARLHRGDTGLFSHVQPLALWIRKGSSNGSSGELLISHVDYGRGSGALSGPVLQLWESFLQTQPRDHHSNPSDNVESR